MILHLRDLFKTPFLPNFCVPDELDLSTGSNFNPRNTTCMDACPDGFLIGVVKVFAFPSGA